MLYMNMNIMGLADYKDSDLENDIVAGQTLKFPILLV